VLVHCSCHNFNLLLHGVGSKQRLIDSFIASKLSDVARVVVNGFFPSLTVKNVSLVCDVFVALCVIFIPH